MNGAAHAVALVVARRFQATPERVFDAWLDPARAARFLFATPEGRMLRVEIDPRVGGRFAIVEQRAEGPAGHFGRYLEIDRPHRLAFTFSDNEADPEGDLVVIEIRPEGAGCELTLTHRLAPAWLAWRDRVEHGWAMVLAGLADLLGSKAGAG